MKKITVIFLLFTLLATPYAIGQIEEGWYTKDNYMNGRWVLHNIEGSDRERQLAIVYIYGVIDGLYAASPQLMYGFYSNYVKEDIAKAVIKYYKKNPIRTNLSVSAVILSGCK